MISDLDDYIEAHISPEPEELRRIDRLTNRRYVNGRMCSGHAQGRLLKMLTAMASPKRVLEIGTFSGYSALCIAEGMPADGIIDTIEIDDEMEDFILENLASSPYGPRVRLHIGDAMQVMEEWKEEEFDMAFIDGDKRTYRECFLKVLPLVKRGGFILADNTLWDNHVREINPRSAQTRGVIAFNELVARYPGIETAIIPVRDGLTIIRKL